MSDMGSFAWPAALVLVSFGFMFIFRDEVSSFLSRAKKIDKEGIEAYDKPQLEESEEENEELDEYMQSYDNPLLAEQENMIEESLSNEGLNKPKNAKSVLVRELAATQIALFFERVESNIFASQVRAMKYLNTLSGQETTVDEVAEIFRQAKNKYADIYSNYPFESWLNFMESRDLIELNEDTIRLRQRGKEYLKWRVESGQAGPHYG